MYTLIFLITPPPPALKKIAFLNIYFRESDKNISFARINFRELSENIHLVGIQFQEYGKNLPNFRRCQHGKISRFNSRHIYECDISLFSICHLIYRDDMISIFQQILLTHLWRRPLSYRNLSIDLFCKSVDWFTVSVMKELNIRISTRALNPWFL